MEIICSHDSCTGCQTCRLICPKKCIEMQEDEKGNIYPVINQKLCINCQKCQKLCPSLNPPEFSEKPINVYAGWSKDRQARKYSTSGAISYTLSKYFLERGWNFCGVIWTNDGAVHKVTSDIGEITQFQGSKYSHSDVKNCYKEIQVLLDANERVLFTGTPCQVAGLKKYLGKVYENLYTVDIICHGVPSRRILRDRINSIEQEHGKRVIEMRFRDKQPDQLHTCCKYIFEDGSFVLHEYNKDFFFRSFVDNYALRENCFNCQYSCLQRVSDMTIADFWGYKPKSMKFYKYEIGVSLIMVNTEKGNQMIDFIKKDIVFESRGYKECSNRNLYAPQAKPAYYDAYWADYNNPDIPKDVIQKKYLSNPIPFSPTIVWRIRKFAYAFFPSPFMAMLNKLMRTIRKIK